MRARLCSSERRGSTRRPQLSAEGRRRSVHRVRVPAPCAHQPAELPGARTVPARLPPGGAAAPPLHARCDTATSRACCRPFRRRHPRCTHVATPQLVACLLPPVPAAVPRAARTLRRRNFSCLLPLAPAAAPLCTHVAMPQPLELCTCPPSVPEAGSVHAPCPRCPCVYTRGASLVFVSCLCTCSCRAAFVPVFVCVSRGTTCFLAHVHGRYREVRRVAHLVACSSRPRGMGSHQRLRTGRMFELPARHGQLPFPAPTPPERGGLVAATLWRRRGGGAACLVSPCALRSLVACCSCCRCPRRSRDARAAHVRAGTHRVLPQRV